MISVLTENARKVGEVGMSYQSPIEVIQSQMRSQIEGEIYKAVMNVGVNVNKDELFKALQYDRNQYQKGYEDRDSEIVRCNDCKNRPIQTDPPKTYGFSIEFPEGSRCPCQCSDGFYSWYPPDDWFCANGKRKESM